MARSYEESQIQQACVEWFRYKYPAYRKLLFAIPNGGKRSKKLGGIMKKEGLTEGVADLFLSVPKFGRAGLYIEMKTPTGRQQKSQKDFQKDVIRVGYGYTICRSSKQFEEIVSQYMEADSLINEFR